MVSRIPQPLRAWQQECLAVLSEMFQRERRALVVGTPGAGKTTLALTFAQHMIRAQEIDYVHVVAPTRALRQHWQDAAASFGLRIGRRSNARLRMAEFLLEIGGVTTTYAQIAKEPDAHLAAIENRRSLVILDEVHHAGDNRAWGEGITDAFASRARFILSLSGTPFRNDKTTISLLKYSPDGATIPDFQYDYSRAIEEDVCRPVLFQPYNALIQYKHRGEQFSNSFTDDLPSEHLSNLLRHALHPQAGLVERMVRDADDELSAIRSRGPRWQDAAGLMVAMNIEHAYECAKVVQEVTGERPVVVASDSEDAEDVLNDFKAGMSRWIVAVRMISEGVDIPRLMVAVYATNVTSTLFFRQLVGRVVRVRHRGAEEVASLFMPGDERLCAEASKIEEEVKRFLSDAPGDSFRSVRSQVERAARRLTEVPPKISDIERQSITYRGEEFSTEEIEHADRMREFFPNGERLDAVQVAWTLRHILQVKEGEAA